MSALRTLNLETSFGKLRVAGGSRAGESTIVLLPQLRLALDAGRPHRAVPPMSTLVISHGHADHLGGIAFWASQRFLGNLGRATLLAPSAIAESIRDLLELHASLEGGRPYDVEVHGVDAGHEHRLRRDIDLTFFATDHWVPTLGTAVVLNKKQLRDELVGLSGEDIASRRRAGETVSQITRIPLLNYCADCGPGLFTASPETLEAEVLVVECSFFKPEDRERARTYGHMHLDDVLDLAPRLRCRHLVLQHASRRHGLREVEHLIESELVGRLPCEVHHLNVDWD